MNENREPKKQLVAGYVKNALLWKNRNPEEMIAYNRFYFEEQLSEMENMELVDVYVDVTGHKETYKRPEMVRLLKDITEGKVNMIYSRTSGYIAANVNELCMLMEFLFEQDEMVDIYTEDEDYQFDTITNPDHQIEELRRMALSHCTLYRKAYEEWKAKLLGQMALLP